LLSAFTACQNSCPISETIEVWGDSHMSRLPFWYHFPAYCVTNNAVSGENFSTFHDRYTNPQGSNAIFCIGVNDFLQNASLSEDELVAYFSSNYDIMLSNARRDYFFSCFIGIMPYTKDFELDNELTKTSIIREINMMLVSKCAIDSKTKCIDIYDYLCNEEGYLKPEYSADGLHLNNTGNEILANAIKNVFSE